MCKERYRTNHRVQDKFHVFRHNPDRSPFLDLEESKSVDEQTAIEIDKMEMFSLSHTRPHQ